jgi:hypothetical protein
MFERIKVERNLSLNNWRYVLLHWFFGISPTTPKESSLPGCFYTHFCPLFHLTNMIALCLPILIPLRIVWAVVKCLLVLVAAVIGPIRDWYQAFLARKRQKALDRNYANNRLALDRKAALWNDPVFVRGQAKIRIVSYLNEYNHDSIILSDFEAFKEDCLWSFTKYATPNQSMEEVEAMIKELHAAISVVIIKKKKERDEKKRARDAWIYNWVHVSQTVIKGLLNVLYVGLFLGCVYLLWTYGIPAVIGAFYGICGICAWAFSVDVWSTLGSILYYGAQVAIGSIVIGGIFWFLAKSKIFITVADTGLKVVRPVLACLDGFGRWCLATADNFADFISMFYAENCPPINIQEKDSVETLVDELEE